MPSTVSRLWLQNGPVALQLRRLHRDASFDEIGQGQLHSPPSRQSRSTLAARSGPSAPCQEAKEPLVADLGLLPQLRGQGLGVRWIFSNIAVPPQARNVMPFPHKLV